MTAAQACSDTTCVALYSGPINLLLLAAYVSAAAVVVVITLAAIAYFGGHQ